MSLTNAPETEQPEEPTNRPAPSYRIREWLSRPYARHFLVLFIIFTVVIMPAAWLVLHFMNQSGAPASAIMTDIETTIFVFTFVSAPLMAVALAILMYSLLGRDWGGRVHGGDNGDEWVHRTTTTTTGSATT
jgi:hypothetical protein